jgi:shikimate kinase
MNLVFVGIKHCGKSALGKALAHNNNLLFIDSDIELSAKYNTLNVRELYKTVGDEKFRKLEAELLIELGNNSQNNTVFSLGGGSVTNPYITNEQLKKALELLGSKVLDIYTTEKEPDFVNTFIPFDEEKENIIIKLTK